MKENRPVTNLEFNKEIIEKALYELERDTLLQDYYQFVDSPDYEDVKVLKYDLGGPQTWN